MARKVKESDTLKIKLIESDDKNPKVALKAGMKLQVAAITIVTPELKKSKKTAARLCGGTDTCLALIDIEP